VEQHLSGVLAHPFRNVGVGERFARGVEDGMSFATRTGELLSEAAGAGAIDQDRGGDGALFFGERRVEAADRRGGLP